MSAIARWRTYAIACLIAGACAAPAVAQVTGTVTGSVKDAQGGVLPGATVTLVSEARGTRLSPVVTTATGDFVFPNVPPDTYTVEVTMSGFKTMQRKGVAVSPADRLVIPTLTLEVGGVTETVDVKGDTPVIQAQSGERSFTVATDSVQSLPIASRSFTALASLAPGVTGTTRIGDVSSTGGGNSHVMMDGVSTMDTGSNRPLVEMNVESIAEVKVLVSSYQAEYGRSSGIQITAVTKSGTNRFRGSLYDVERNSNWNANSKTNKLNGDPKNISKSRDWGYSIGGPVGKPGGQNKLFFFYTQEFEPRTQGNDVQRYRMPTALERAGDFSQTTDNNGNPFFAIRDYQLTGTCSNTVTTACFADGGVVGKIPASRLYQTGINILNMYPLPNIANVPPGQNYNFQITRPEESLLGYQPAVRLDYQASQSLRATFKWGGFIQRKQTINGTLPGWNDTRMQNPIVSTMAITVNYNLTPTMFLEGTYGHSQNEQAGCAITGAGPTFCQNALPVNPISNRNVAGLGTLPMLFPNALVLNPDYYAYRVLSSEAPPIWENGQVLKTPNFTWAGRVANSPPNAPFPGFLNTNQTDDFSVSLTKVWGRHTIKTGFYNTHSYKAQQQGNPFGTISFQNDTNNPLDSQFPFANAVLGIFGSYQQQSGYIEGIYVYNNTEGYIQDNWKLSDKLTLDYGVRLVHMQPQYDSLGQASNFLLDEWNPSQAPRLYVAGCTITVAPGAACPTANRQAMDPVTGQFLGPNSVPAIGGLIPNTGNRTNGLFQSGQGIAETTYTWPALGVAPRFGAAYDLSGNQTLVMRGGAGLYFDRPSGNSIYPQVTNPPSVRNVTVRYGQLQSFGSGGLTTEGPPALAVFEYAGGLPASVQWNFGTQMMLPWATSLDVEYVGQHGYNIIENININAVDFESALLPQNQDSTLAANPVPGQRAVSTDLMRAIRGYGAITLSTDRGFVTHHSLQISFQRRFMNGVSFGFNDTIGLYSRRNTGARIQHAGDGSWTYRADQAEAEDLLQTDPIRHTMKANFIWDLPDIRSDDNVLRAIGLVLNDWQFSGIWTASTGAPYSVAYSYQSAGNNVNLTGSPDYGGRVRLVGDVGSGCSDDVYKQFNTSAFQGPGYGSVGLESGNSYLHGCFSSVLDIAVARNIRLGGSKTLQLRVDMFNAPNAAGITGRNATMNLPNPNDPTNIQNLPYDANGNLITARSLPRGAGFGVANGYQAPRTVQLQVRFTF